MMMMMMMMMMTMHHQKYLLCRIIFPDDHDRVVKLRRLLRLLEGLVNGHKELEKVVLVGLVLHLLSVTMMMMMNHNKYKIIRFYGDRIVANLKKITPFLSRTCERIRGKQVCILEITDGSALHNNHHQP